MQHITLTKIHGYIAVFFFPMAILYAITGTAYIVGEGGEAIRTTYEFPQQTQWPTDVDQARLLAATLLEQENLPPPSTIMGQRVLGDNGYSWRGFTHGVTLNRDENQQITPYTDS